TSGYKTNPNQSSRAILRIQLPMMNSVPLASSLRRTRHLALFFSLKLCSMWLPCFYSVRISRETTPSSVRYNFPLPTSVGRRQHEREKRSPSQIAQETNESGDTAAATGDIKQLREFLGSERKRRAQLENDAIF